MERTKHRCGRLAAVLFPLLLGGCLAGGRSLPEGFGYRAVMRIESSPAAPAKSDGGAAGQQIAMAPDGRMRWISAPKGWTTAPSGLLMAPQRADRARIARAYAPSPAATPAATESAGGFVLPVSGAILTSTFGMREHPILGGDRLHSGIDLAAATGTAVRAAVAGTVGAAGRNGGYGNYVRIDHGTISTAYAHLDAYAPGVTQGAAVAAGDIIGYVGSTGRSTGPHLHFEVLVGDDAIDPMSVMPTALQVALGAAPRVELARGGR